VDTSCIACGVCKEVAAGIFDVDDSQGYAVVTRQPATPQEQSLAAEARSQCPVDAIGQDGQ
jgi:ferredoxin